ncbi:MAG TPA: Hsp70 family protein [Verrucomicrobiales bacterium]|jgi:molecular chaperone DnaK|nr:Hsp70 family protein [Verrucomicrobiales bacterium]
MADIVGIDLGTTNSLIGIVEAGFPILLADAGGSRMTPSAVYFPPDGGEPEVGAAAKRRSLTSPERTVVSVKRLIGRRPGELDHTPEYATVRDSRGGLSVRIDDRLLSPVEISAMILRHLKAVAERALERPVSRAVITVPAYFNDAQRTATRQAGELAGFTVERIVNEPTAAALAFGLDKLGERSRVAVYDLGGGTFDISILEMNEGVFLVLATHGDTALGGDDIDRALTAWLEAQAFPDKNRPGPEIRARLHGAAVELKHTLSSQESAEVRLPFLDGQEHFQRVVTRAEFESIAAPILERTRAHCLRTLSDAGLKPAELNAVVLVGGSTRIPLVRRLTEEIFGRVPDTSQHPDETVALGAVIQAGILSGALQKMVLLDVTPLSLGIETFGGLMNVILPRNTTIPARAGELFTNAVANQQSMLIRVLQGEREMARDNWELGQFQIDFQPGPKGHARVGVQFEIDADGILHILARDTKTNTDKLLEIRHSAVDVDDVRVEEMISASVEHAFDDMHERQWTAAKLKAEELLDAVAAALPAAGDAVDGDTRKAIEYADGEVRAALAAEDLIRLKSANHQLDTATEALAAIIVERAMEQALQRRGLV